jgi:hypothetical protein
MAANNNEHSRPELGKVILAPIYDTVSIPGHTHIVDVPAEIVEIGPCMFEVTEAAVTNFSSKLDELLNDKHFKEVFQYTFPSMFPTLAPIDSISDGNPLKPYQAEFDVLKVLNSPALRIHERRAKVVELMYAVTNDDIRELLELSSEISKPTQIIKVLYIHNNPDSAFGYYVLFDCAATGQIVNIADAYASISEFDFNDNETIKDLSPLLPCLIPGAVGRRIQSELPNLYTIPQISAINSWITHGLLSTYLMRPDYLQSICTNPLIGDSAFWDSIRTMMEQQFADLYSASKPLEAEMIVYRGSEHFTNHPVQIRTIIATSIENKIANRFNQKRLAKRIVIPAGTHIIDLSDLNILEKEVLILPSHGELAIEPLFLSPNTSLRNKYRIRNAGVAAGGAGVGSKGGGPRRRLRKTRKVNKSKH